MIPLSKIYWVNESYLLPNGLTEKQNSMSGKISSYYSCWNLSEATQVKYGKWGLLFIYLLKTIVLFLISEPCDHWLEMWQKWS